MLSLLAPAPASAAERPEGCVQVARIVSVQGSLQILRRGQIVWSVVRKLDTALCQGDLLHAGPGSRAALLITPETLVRLDQSSTLSVRQTQDETVVEFAKDPGLFQPVGTAPNPCGAGYFITRFPRKFRVIAPFIDATVEGTEFLVALRCESTQVAVFEGRVLAQQVQTASSRAFSLIEGESLEAGGPQPAGIKLLVKPVDAVQWALYYPPITDAAGDVAADQKCDLDDSAARSVCILQRAEQRLRSGRVEEAEGDIQTLLRLGLGDGDAYALLSIISVVKNDKAKALELASRATQQSPNSPRAWLALSYAQQAAFQLDPALASSRKAAQLPPQSATAQARVAELLMTQGRSREAVATAQAAVAADPQNSRAHTVLGFATLAQANTSGARAEFLTAIEHDSTDPLPRLGLGLAIIREGDLKAGREQIEIAVALDPSNSLIRSYVGKAYYEENMPERDTLAATQFGIAKELDPKDPTPWLYDAILKQTQNHSVLALEDAQKSIELNDYRAINRSRTLLDQDLAVRGTEVARIFTDLGFGELAQLEGARALANDPTSPSAHRFLADSYLGAPRHEVGRLSELLQSQLWQPLNLQPIRPELEVSDLYIPRSATLASSLLEGPSPLFIRNGASVVADFALGSNDTVATDIAVAALKGPLSLGLGGFYYNTTGFRENADQTQTLANVFLQYSWTPQTSLQAEVRQRHEDQGDLALRFDANKFSPNLRYTRDISTYRLGFRQDFSPQSKLILSALYQRTEESQSDAFTVPPLPFPGTASLTADFRQSAYLTEGQYVLQLDRTQIIAGLGYYAAEDDTDGSLLTTLSVPFPPFSLSLPPVPIVREERLQHFNGYVYTRHLWRDRLGLVLGLSVDDVDSKTIQSTQWNPKVGLNWLIGAGWTARAAAFRTTTRDLVNNQTIEPTQIVGFNQFFDDPVGTESWNYGVGIDKAFTPRLYAGGYLARRDLTVPFIVAPSNVLEEAQVDETLGRAYLYWAPDSRLAVRVQYQYDERERDANLALRGYDYTKLRTQQTLFGLTWLMSSQWSAYLTTTWTAQDGTFQDTLSAQTSQGSDHFWLADVELRWRIPQRHGFVSVGVRNLFDTEFQFHEPDAGTPLVYPERFAYVRVNLSF